MRSPGITRSGVPSGAAVGCVWKINFNRSRCLVGGASTRVGEICDNYNDNEWYSLVFAREVFVIFRMRPEIPGDFYGDAVVKFLRIRCVCLPLCGKNFSEFYENTVGLVLLVRWKIGIHLNF